MEARELLNTVNQFGTESPLKMNVTLEENNNLDLVANITDMLVDDEGSAVYLVLGEGKTIRVGDLSFQLEKVAEEAEVCFCFDVEAEDVYPLDSVLSDEDKTVYLHSELAEALDDLKSIDVNGILQDVEEQVQAAEELSDEEISWHEDNSEIEYDRNGTMVVLGDEGQRTRVQPKMKRK